MALDFRDVYVFVDWDTTRRCRWLDAMAQARIHRGGAPAQLAATMEAVAERVARLGRATRYRVETRIYHGWHRGNQPTDDHRALHGLVPKNSYFDDGRILFAPPVLGDTLACQGRYSTLRDTLRRRDDDSGDEQKMVDTAMAADLLYLARRSSGTGGAEFLVLSEDDDMIPPVVVAREWGLPCRILRRRGPSRCLPRTRELILPFNE